MSVYTVVERPVLEHFLRQYDAGSLADFRGIEAGIENTNYFVTTSAGRYVLTVFEAASRADLDYFLALMAHFAERGIPSAHPVADRSGRYLGELAGKPAALVARLPGVSVMAPNGGHCRAIGAVMAQMHQAAVDFESWRANDRGSEWRDAVRARLLPKLSAADVELLEEACAAAARASLDDLPAGVIHADLFRDNALFENGSLTGVIDFYYAFNGPYIYDLAVLVADWCRVGDEFDRVRTKALLEAYDEQRALTEAERAAWRPALLHAGLRFWLSRLHDATFPRHGAITQIKAPAPFRTLVCAALEPATPLEALLAEALD